MDQSQAGSISGEAVQTVAQPARARAISGGI